MVPQMRRLPASSKTSAVSYNFPTLVTEDEPSQTGDLFQAQNSSGIALFKIQAGGNVGLGSLTPGQILDVQGTVRTTSLTVSGHVPIVGYVLTSLDSAGDSTWGPIGGVVGVSGWTVTGTNVFETNGGNVGIGTNLVTTSALTVMNGNVGIGTGAPAALFSVNGNSILGINSSTMDTIVSSGTGSMAGGNASHGGGNIGNISSSNFGSFAYGAAQGNGFGSANIIANSVGSIALGVAGANSNLESTSSGAIALGFATSGILQSGGAGAPCYGSCKFWKLTGNWNCKRGHR